tara:strand:- start:38 stop:1123 length:1086 start_codon:yes stop_codon:yes gene_type:complete
MTEEQLQFIKGLGKSVARGVPQLATGLIDLAALPLTMSGISKPEDIFMSTEYLTKRGFLPPPQTGLINQGTELATSMLNPAGAAKTGLVALGGVMSRTGKGLSGYTDEAAEAWKNANAISKEKQLQNIPQDPEVRNTFKSYLDGNINQGDYIRAMEIRYPSSKINTVPEITPLDEIVFGIGKKSNQGKDVVGLGVKFDTGDRILSRLDIPAYNRYNVWSASLKGKNGETVYGQTVHLNNKGGKIKFQVNPNDAMRIAKGKELGGSNKFPMATIDGNWINTKPENVKKLAEKYLNNPEWSQVGMNPRRFGYFYDKADNMPVSEADEVIQIGALVLAKNVKKFDPSKSITNTVNPKTGKMLSF